MYAYYITSGSYCKNIFLKKFRGQSRDITERKRAAEALRESEERYRTLFEASPDGILIADAETMKFRYASPSLCEMLGYGEDELRKMGVEDIHPKDKLEDITADFEALTRGEITFTENIPCLKKDGTIIYVDISGTTTVIDGRKCLIGFFRDITARKHLEEQLRNTSKIGYLPAPFHVFFFACLRG